jgi:hypothetical protein
MIAPVSGIEGAILDFEVKASILRGIVSALKASGKLAVVQARLDPATRAMTERPPVSSAWVSGPMVAALQVAIVEALGPAEAQAIGAESITIETGPLMRTMTEGIVRLFGATPDSLLSRLSMFESLTLRNIKQQWTQTAEHRGYVSIRYVRCRQVPDALPIMSAGMLEPIFGICRTEGTARFRGWASDARDEAIIDFEWHER